MPAAGERVFPARAGMNRNATDSPDHVAVFPARAGMNRWTCRTTGSKTRVPRAGGDEPAEAAVRVKRYECSPRGRG